ncbi:MAG TPA: hypothetical protein VG986_10015 [Pseudolabrys sp.]|nr:hypothetical protein [Pseudolabrys sp.]
MTARRYTKLVLAAAFSLVAGAAMAQAPQNAQTPHAQETAQPPRAGSGPNAKLAVQPGIVADAPNARLAALVRRDVVLVRNKGVASVNRISTGVYCISPMGSTGITPSTAIVMLTPEYYYSRLNEIKVQWASAGSNCGSNRIAVYTFADIYANGVYRLSNLVSFSIVVP